MANTSQEEQVAKASDCSSKALGSVAARPYDQQRFGGARSATSTASTSLARPTEPSLAGPSTSTFPIANDQLGVPPVMAVEQERLDSAIASILGDSVKDDDADFLGGLDDSTALLDINVGDAASAVASLAHLGIDNIAPLDSSAPTLAAAGNEGISYPDPFMNVGVPSSSSSGFSVAPIMNLPTSFVPTQPVEVPPKETSRKRQRRQNGKL